MKPIRTYYPNGKLMEEEWLIDGKYHRVDGPAYQKWHEDGKLEYESWRINGACHRLDGPAFQRWHIDGHLWEEDWCIDGKLHRVDGPAWQEWYENGQFRCEEWWIEGKKVEPISDPLEWTLFLARTFGHVHGLEKFCKENLGEKAAMTILASAKII